MDREINRLAWGLVRSEQHGQALDFYENINNLQQCVFSKKLIFAQRAGATAKQLAKIESDVSKTLEAQGRFKHTKLKTPVPGLPVKVDMETAFVWSALETSFERKGGEELPDASKWGKDGIDRKFFGFQERNFRLGFQRKILSKRSLIVQWIHQRIALSEHALYRMVDRGVCEREPLAYLNSTIDEWLPAINALMLTGVKGGFIPFADGGLVLQTYLVVEPEDHEGAWNYFDRFALVAQNGAGFGQGLLMPSPTDLEVPEGNGRKAWFDWRITTYLTDQQLCSSRLWVKLEFEKIKERFPVEWSKLAQLNTMLDLDPEACAMFSNEHSDFVLAMNKFVTNHRFREARRSPNT